MRAHVKHPKSFADTTDFAIADPEQKEALYLFNCAQRAHANYVENHPSTAIALLLAGLQYPEMAAALGVGWIVGRVIFALGYTRKTKENGRGRMIGFAIHFPLQLVLWGLAVWTGVKMARLPMAVE